MTVEKITKPKRTYFSFHFGDKRDEFIDSIKGDESEILFFVEKDDKGFFNLSITDGKYTNYCVGFQAKNLKDFVSCAFYDEDNIFSDILIFINDRDFQEGSLNTLWDFECINSDSMEDKEFSKKELNGYLKEYVNHHIENNNQIHGWPKDKHGGKA